MPRCPFHRPPLLRGRRPANPRHWKSNNRETSFRKATISTPIEQTRFLLVIKLSSFAVFRRSRNSSWYCSLFFLHVTTWSCVSYSPNTLVDTLRVLKFYGDRRNSSGRSTSCTSVVGKVGTNEDFLLRLASTRGNVPWSYFFREVFRGQKFLRYCHKGWRMLVTRG